MDRIEADQAIVVAIAAAVVVAVGAAAWWLPPFVMLLVVLAGVLGLAYVQRDRIIAAVDEYQAERRRVMSAMRESAEPPASDGPVPGELEVDPGSWADTGATTDDLVDRS